MRGLRVLRAHAGLARRVLAARWRPGRPFKITLVLTERCDCRCRMCLIWQKPRSREMTPQEIRSFLAAAPSLAWVNLTGGEIFLREDVPEVAEAVREALPHLAALDFPTTGQAVDRILGDVDRIARLGIPRLYVTVSVEGPPEVHDRLRGRRGAFDRMVRTYAGLRAIGGVRPYLGMTLSDANADRVEATLDALRERVPEVGWRDLHFNVFTRSAHYYANEAVSLDRPARLPAPLRRALRAREGSSDPLDLVEAAYLRLLPSYLRTGRSPLPCQSLAASVFVGPAGEVHPCTVWERPLGNVLERPLYEILRHPTARAAREVVRRDACPGCWSPCEAHPTIVAGFPRGVLVRRGGRPGA